MQRYTWTLALLLLATGGSANPQSKNKINIDNDADLQAVEVTERDFVDLVSITYPMPQEGFAAAECIDRAGRRIPFSSVLFSRGSVTLNLIAPSTGRCQLKQFKTVIRTVTGR